MKRYRTLPGLFLAFVLALVTGCERDKPHYNGIDVTGAAIGPDFRLLDPDGKWRSLGEFREQYVMLFFGFTQCPDVCPTSLARAAVVRRSLAAEGIPVQVVFVTVDPERDTPARLREYASAFGGSFTSLTGPPERLAEIRKAYGVVAEKRVVAGTSAAYLIDHSAFVYIIDPAGQLRLMFPFGMPVEDMTHDIKLLMQR